MDAIDARGDVMRRYRIAALRYGARELASLVWQSTMQVRVAVEALEQRTGVHERAVEINRLENEADDAARRGAAPAVRGREGRDHRDQVEGDPRPARSRRPTAARTAPTSSKASSSSTAERRRRESARGRRPDRPVALVFDYINGFHDAANSIATVVSTRVLSPGRRSLGGVLQLRRRVPLRHGRRQDGRHRHDRHQRRDLRGDLRRADRRDHLGPDHAGTSACRRARRTR